MYTSSFYQSYKASKSKLPIQVWAEVVGKRLPQFKSVDDIYAPIPLAVKIAGSLNDSNGTVKLSVQPTNPNWYEDLREALSEMTGERNIQIQSYLGKPIENLTPEQLMRVGECDCVNLRTQQPIRLKEAVAPPLRMSTNKQGELRRWWGENQDALSETVAKQLVGLSMSEIAKATLLNGPVQSCIERHLVNNTLHDLPWEEFLQTYGNGKTSSSDLSKTLLDAVRQALQANEPQIRNHHASVGSEASLWKGNVQSTSYKDDFTLYRDIIEDAMYHPFVTNRMVQGVMQGTRTATAVATKPPSLLRKVSNFHPLSSYYQQHHYVEHGKLPGHRIEELNRNNGRISSQYPGDASKAMDMFNLLTGRGVLNKKEENEKISSPIPIGTAVKHAQDYLGVLPIKTAMEHAESYLIACHNKEKKKKKKEEEESVKSQIPPMPGLIPISEELIEGHRKWHKKEKEEEEDEKHHRKSVGSQVGANQTHALPRLIPIASQVDMPRLIPINDSLNRPGFASATQQPILVPSDHKLGKKIWVDDGPDLEDFL